MKRQRKKAVFIEKRHINQKLVNFCGLRNIPLYASEKLDELEETYQTTISNVEHLSEAIKGGTDNTEAMQTAMRNLGIGLKTIDSMTFDEINAELGTVNRQIENIELALKYACVNSASVCEHFGAQEGFLTFDEINEKLKKEDLKVEKIKV